MPSGPRVLIFGEMEHCDFAALRRCLAEQEYLVDLDEAPSMVDLVVLCQSRPGQFAQDQIESLHQRFPLASLLAVLGTWCQGEQRSGYPWHGVDRVYSYNAIARICALLDREPRFLRTQTTAERIDQLLTCVPHARSGVTACVISHSQAGLDAASDACRALGIKVSSAPASADLILLWGDTGDSLGIANIRSLRTSFPNARIVAVLNYPRDQDATMLLDAGCSAVLGKPLLLIDLAGSCADLFATGSFRSSSL
jgi:hypothetical protein